MSRRSPVTAAVRVLREAGVDYTEHIFDYERHPGAVAAAEAIGVDPHLAAKTIVFATPEGNPLVVVMHGYLEVSTKKVAREVGVKGVRPATQGEGRRWTGYRFGGTSPFGMRTDAPVLVQSTLLDLDIIYINAGRRGFLVGIDPKEVVRVTGGHLVDVAMS